MITKLQLGASRLENLNSLALSTFLDRSWLHMGCARPERINPVSKIARTINDFGLLYVLNAFIHKSLNRRVHRKYSLDEKKIYRETNFCIYYFNKGENLPFEDNSFDFIFSEHFFEHLFLDEAFALMRECLRVLKPNGVMRTCVPDADLRTYAEPEPVGFPNRKLPFTHPDKHKTRWSVYSLSQVIEWAGFVDVPLRYCDKHGHLINNQPSDIPKTYTNCLQHKTVFDLSYIQRLEKSLIIDGIKKPA